MTRTAATLVVLLLLGTGCTTKTEIRPADPADFPASRAPAPHNDTDVAYAHELTAMHEQAVDMARSARVKEVSASVGDLAARVERTRVSQLVGLDALRGTWDVERHASDFHGNPGELTERQLSELDALEGAEFEALWLARMVANYRGSVAMSRAELDLGLSLEGREYARQVIEGLEADLEALERHAEP